MLTPRRHNPWAAGGARHAPALAPPPAAADAPAPLYGDPPDWENAGAIDYGAQGMSQG